jgi:hypothetical protein
MIVRVMAGILTIAGLLCAQNTPHAASAVYNGAFEISGALDYNLRRGYFDIHGLRQDSALAPLTIYSVSLAKRYELAPFLRLRVGASFGGGSVDVDTVENVHLTDGTAHTVARSQQFWRIALTPELQYVLPAQGAIIPFLRIAVAGSYLWMNENGRTVDPGSSQQQRVLFADTMSARMPGIDVRAGLGFDVAISRRAGLSFAYAVGYGQPVRYAFSSELPLRNVDYWESFRSHSFAVAIIWNGAGGPPAAPGIREE